MRTIFNMFAMNMVSVILIYCAKIELALFLLRLSTLSNYSGIRPVNPISCKDEVVIFYDVHKELNISDIMITSIYDEIIKCNNVFLILRQVICVEVLYLWLQCGVASFSFVVDLIYRCSFVTLINRWSVAQGMST